MKVEDYEKLVNSMISEPEKAGDTGKTIMENIKADAEASNALTETVSNQKKTIAELNSKIFMTTTGKPDTVEEEHEETPREIFNKLFDERFYPNKEA